MSAPRSRAYQAGTSRCSEWSETGTALPTRRAACFTRRTQGPQNPSMALFGNVRPAAAHQKIEVCAAMGLEHMINIQVLVTSYGRRSGRLPARAPADEFRLRDRQMKTAALDVQLNEVTALHEGERTTHGCFGRSVQD